MKKLFLFIFVASLAICFSSCSNDDDNNDEKEIGTTINIHVGDSVKLDEDYVPNNIFIAFMNGKYLKANHVGYTSLKGKNVTRIVKVIGNNNKFINPILDWGTSPENIVSKCTAYSLYDDSSEGGVRLITYKQVAPYSTISYGFVGNRLQIVYVDCPISYFDSYSEYLKERFVFVSKLNDNLTFIGADGYSLDKIKTYISITVSNYTTLTKYYDKNYKQ